MLQTTKWVLIKENKSLIKSNLYLSVSEKMAAKIIDNFTSIQS